MLEESPDVRALKSCVPDFDTTFPSPALAVDGELVDEVIDNFKPLGELFQALRRMHDAGCRGDADAYIESDADADKALAQLPADLVLEVACRRSDVYKTWLLIADAVASPAVH